jgi:hypothetical protein
VSGWADEQMSKWADEQMRMLERIMSDETVIGFPEETLRARQMRSRMSIEEDDRMIIWAYEHMRRWKDGEHMSIWEDEKMRRWEDEDEKMVSGWADEQMRSWRE